MQITALPDLMLVSLVSRKQIPFVQAEWYYPAQRLVG